MKLASESASESKSESKIECKYESKFECKYESKYQREFAHESKFASESKFELKSESKSEPDFESESVWLRARLVTCVRFLRPAVQCLRDKAAQFALRLYECTQGLGTDDETLVRTVVSRCEVDMVQIKRAFETSYKQPLAAYIAVREVEGEGEGRWGWAGIVGGGVFLQRFNDVLSLRTTYFGHFGL